MSNEELENNAPVNKKTHFLNDSAATSNVSKTKSNSLKNNYTNHILRPMSANIFGHSNHNNNNYCNINTANERFSLTSTPIKSVVNNNNYNQKPNFVRNNFNSNSNRMSTSTTMPTNISSILKQYPKPVQTIQYRSLIW